MATYSIDTAEAIKHLKQNGFEEQQAEAIVHTFGRTQDDLVSKKDLDLAIEGLRKDLTGEIQTVRTDLTGEIQKVRDDMSSQFKWIIGIVLGGFLATFLGVIGLVIALLNMAGGGAG